ncbi:MAG: phosphomethylpyrimidine synthase ThiC [Elusimicrobiota bacterium]
MTQLQAARQGRITPQIEAAAAAEGLPPEYAREQVACGRAVIPANRGHDGLRPAAIGMGFRCKVNANLGASRLLGGIRAEERKLDLAVRLGADAVMDLSTAGDLAGTRRVFLACGLPVGTVPVYEALARAGSPESLDVGLLLGCIEEQAEQGVDFMTVHAGLLREHLPLVRRRLTGIVSRGGAALAHWMRRSGRQNPLYERFDDICSIFKKHDVCFSLGDGLRPGCLADAGDPAQFAELDVLGELTRRARRQGVQVMVEGPGHVPMDQVAMHVDRARRLCGDAPFYVLGPLVTDISPGYDHISAAIGGALAAWAGASLLCYVTPKEHLGLPGIDDVRDGVIASRIAAHAADIARGRPGARRRDDELSKARYAFDWEKQFQLSFDPEKAGRSHEGSDGEARCCSMCGEGFCAMRLSRP